MSKFESSFKSEVPVFSEFLIPKRVFIMRTHKKGGEVSLEKIKEMVREKLGALKMSQEIIDSIVEKGARVLKAKLDQHDPEVDQEELHSLVVAHDVKGECLKVYATAGHQHGETFHNQEGQPFLLFNGAERKEKGMSDDEIETTVEFNFVVSTERLQSDTDWKGERELPACTLEAETHSEMLAKLEKAGYLANFLTLFPETITDESPLPENTVVPSPISIAPALKAKQRAALVRVYGEKKIHALEKKIAERRKEIK